MTKLETLVAAMNATGFGIVSKDKEARPYAVAKDESGTPHFINSNSAVVVDLNGMPTGATMYVWSVGAVMTPKAVVAEAAPFPTEPVAGEQLTLGL
jgi:hypothetical protein